jgi:hypothetical protein
MAMLTVSLATKRELNDKKNKALKILIIACPFNLMKTTEYIVHHMFIRLGFKGSS